MSTVLDRNMAALATVQPDAVGVILRSRRDQRLTQITTRDGTRGISTPDKTLHSKYDPYKEAGRILAGTVPDRTATVIVAGLGGGFTVRAIVAHRPRSTVIVLERSPEAVRSILEWIDLSREIRTGRVFFCTDRDHLRETLTRVHVHVLRDEVAIVNTPSWTERNENRPHFDGLLKTLRETLSGFRDEAAAIRRFSRRWLAHTFHNTQGMIHSNLHTRAMQELHHLIDGQDLVVAAAGPGLDQALPQLDGCRVLAVDTAVPPLRAAGITPAAVITLDPQTWSALHLRGGTWKHPYLVADPGVVPCLVRGFPANRVVWYRGTHPLHQLLFAAGAPMLALPGAAESVTEAAVLIARGLGAATVRVVGADGCFPGARQYARGTAYHGLALRTGTRTEPAEHFFARRVYPASDQTRGSTGSREEPFFSTPAMGERSRRIMALLELEAIQLSWPMGRTTSFNAGDFWHTHLIALNDTLHRLRTLPPDGDVPTPTLMNTLGPHGIAHVPVIGRHVAAAHHETGTEGIARAIDAARTFISRENDRYS